MDASSSAPAKANRFSRQNILVGLIALTAVALIGGFLYWWHQSQFVFSDKADVEAPLIALAPQTQGVLMRVDVSEGDQLHELESVARVGDEILTTQVAGLAVAVQKDIGATYKSGQAVVTMIEPKELRVVARIAEDKGLKDIRIGQHAYFTIDAYGSKVFEGTVSSISPTKREGDVVFNISDKREEKEFDVKIDFDHQLYSDFQNGMSARVWIVK